MLQAGLPIYSILFFVFSAALVASSLCVVFVKHTVQSALWLIVTFVISSALWMMLEAEFLALALIFVYVGAVLTLFLFVVMMINTDKEDTINPVKRLLPFAILLMVLLFSAIGGSMIHFSSQSNTVLNNEINPDSSTLSNTMALGNILYTHYVLAFEMAGAVLLVAIIGAISLAFFGSDASFHKKIIRRQRRASKASGLRIVDIPSGTSVSVSNQEKSL
jgi:NADH-quinone oxidoreductase subunit J